MIQLFPSDLLVIRSLFFVCLLFLFLLGFVSNSLGMHGGEVQLARLSRSEIAYLQQSSWHLRLANTCGGYTVLQEFPEVA